ELGVARVSGVVVDQRLQLVPPRAGVPRLERDHDVLAGVVLGTGRQLDRGAGGAVPAADAFGDGRVTERVAGRRRRARRRLHPGGAGGRPNLGRLAELLLQTLGFVRGGRGVDRERLRVTLNLQRVHVGIVGVVVDAGPQIVAGRPGLQCLKLDTGT